MKDADLDRLLKSAAAATDPKEPIEIPFGFATRVVALWRANANGSSGVRAVTQLLRRVALTASIVIVVASAGVYFQVDRNRGLAESSANEFAIADSLIQDEFGQ
jgi:hypothetical protein